MDHAEEQQMEVEALEAIYMDDFNKISESPLEYKVYLEPEQGAGEEENHVSLYLTIKVPATYPEVVPEMSIEVKKGLGEHHIQEIRQIIDTEAQENIGMAMVFTIAEKIKEWLVENNVKGSDGSMHAAMLQRMEQKKKEAEAAKEAEEASKAVLSTEEAEEERRKQRLRDGTPVTPDSFAEWHHRFKEEMRAARRARAGASDGFAAAAMVEASPTVTKPTGRQLFERDMVQREEEDEDEEKMPGSEDWPEAAENVEVNEELFADDEEEDLDDLEDSDDDEET